MRKLQNSGQPLFDFLDIHVSELDKHSGAIQTMLFDGSFQGMVIREVLSEETVERVNNRLKDDYGGVERCSYPGEVDQTLYLLGEAIVSCQPDLQEYFIHAEKYRESCRCLFAGNPDFETMIGSTFQQLSGNLPAKVPEGPQGETYTSSTIRVLLEGGEIGIHVGMDFLNLPQSKHLKTLLDLTSQLSFFVSLSVPESGGELIVYALEYDDVSIFMPRTENNSKGRTYLPGTKTFGLVDQYPSISVLPSSGDMVIFDGGRYFHRISKVVGQRLRRTIGGFLGLSKERDTVYYWS